MRVKEIYICNEGHEIMFILFYFILFYFILFYFILFYFILFYRRWVYGNKHIPQGIAIELMLKLNLLIVLFCVEEINKGKRVRGWIPRICVLKENSTQLNKVSSSSSSLEKKEENKATDKEVKTGTKNMEQPAASRRRKDKNK